MTAIRLGTATLVVLVALTCDITEVAGPPEDSPDAELALTPEDWVQGLFDRLAIHSSRSAVAPDQRPCRQQEVLPPYLVDKGVKSPSGFFLRFRM